MPVTRPGLPVALPRPMHAQGPALSVPPPVQEAVRQGFDARCAALQRLLCLPPLAREPLDSLAAAASPQRLAQLLLGNSGAGGMSTAPAATAQPNEAAALAAAGAAAAPFDAVGQGVALLGSRDFDARARVLALCGWDLKVMLAGAAAAAGGSEQQAEAAEGLPQQVGPESAALQCSLCAARAGLWAFFPRCKPVVLPAPRRRGLAGSRQALHGATHTSAGLAKLAASRNVAADIATTIAGGAMLPGAAGGPAAAPFGAAAQQVAAFGAPGVAAAGAAAQDSAAAAAGSEEGRSEQEGQAGQLATAAGPFGGSSRSGSVPVFGFAALQASAAPALGGAARERSAVGGASIKRKQPDFSWSAVVADIEAKAASEKRSRAASTGGGAAGTLAAPVPSAGPSSNGTAGGSGQAANGQQQRAAVAAAAARYGSAEASPLDPLALHRPFCPWVNSSQASCAGRPRRSCAA